MSEDTKIYRVLDANANRAREGLRVVEEYVRLVRDRESLTSRLKGLRHQITGVFTSMEVDDKLLQGRESDTDVGAGAPVETESNRVDLNHIVTANLRRSQEALRVLEEYSKLLSVEASSGFKRIRFEIYTLEKDLHRILGEEREPGDNVN